jgi:hypothetical protein
VAVRACGRSLCGCGLTRQVEPHCQAGGTRGSGGGEPHTVCFARRARACARPVALSVARRTAELELARQRAEEELAAERYAPRARHARRAALMRCVRRSFNATEQERLRVQLAALRDVRAALWPGCDLAPTARAQELAVMEARVGGAAAPNLAEWDAQLDRHRKCVRARDAALGGVAAQAAQRPPRARAGACATWRGTGRRRLTDAATSSRRHARLCGRVGPASGASADAACAAVQGGAPLGTRRRRAAASGAHPACAPVPCAPWPTRAPAGHD